MGDELMDRRCLGLTGEVEDMDWMTGAWSHVPTQTAQTETKTKRSRVDQTLLGGGSEGRDT